MINPIWIVLASTVGAGPVTFSDYRESVAQELTELCKQDFNGVVLVAPLSEQPQQALVQPCGYSDFDHGLVVSDNTSFYIASATKLLTAMVVMNLVEEGALSLHARAGEFIPYLRDELASITVHQLLTHQSGLPEFYEGQGEKFDVLEFVGLSRPIDEVMAYAQRDLMSVPGSEFFYADTNYLYLSAIIMRITNQPIRKTIDEKILAPLGMAHSGFYGGVSDPVAVTYMDANADGWIQAPHIARDIGYGASAAYANAHDLLKLMRGVLGDGVENGGRFAPMLTKYVDGNGFSYGYGFEYVTLESERSGRTYEYWGHAGGPSFGVNTVVGYNPGSDSITIVLSNIHTVDAKAVYVLVQEAIVEAME